MALAVLLLVVIGYFSCHVGYRQVTRPGDIKALDLIIPVEGITNLDNISPFGSSRQHGRRLHTGIDILAPEGTAVLAPQDGRIVRKARHRTAGIYLYMLDYRGEYVYEFLHLQRYAEPIKVGDEIRQGQVIGYVGKTGNARNGPPHLHFAIARLMKTGDYRGEKRYLDPLLFYRPPGGRGR